MKLKRETILPREIPQPPSQTGRALLLTLLIFAPAMALCGVLYMSQHRPDPSIAEGPFWTRSRPEPIEVYSHGNRVLQIDYVEASIPAVEVGPVVYLDHDGVMKISGGDQ